MLLINRLLLLLAFLLLPFGSNSQSRQERKQLFSSTTNYEIQILGVGQDGTKVFKIWAYGKNVDEAIATAKKQAVRACLFRGLPGSEHTNASPAICDGGTADEQQHADFFREFFTTGGQYLNYVNITTDGVPSGQDRLKVKGGYKVGLKVQVLYNNLRKTMEQEGIRKKLDYLF